MIKIKKKIDKAFGEKPEKKRVAYALFFGVCTGLRQGNILGLKAEDLRPDDEIPHFRVSDNVVNGYSRGEKGAVVFVNATKTTSEEDGEILLPMIQPSVAVITEVARYLVENVNSKERICGDVTPSGFYRVWWRISRECQFKFLNPHNWKHSYATNGADNLQAWYKGDPRLLQICCLHTSFKMTEKYIKKRHTHTLKLFAKG